MVFGMAPGQSVELSALAQLFECVGPHRVQQPVERSCSIHIRRNERFRD